MLTYNAWNVTFCEPNVHKYRVTALPSLMKHYRVGIARGQLVAEIVTFLFRESHEIALLEKLLTTHTCHC